MTRLTQPLRERVVKKFCNDGWSISLIALDMWLLPSQVEQIIREALKGKA
jgi:hypothetical protein